MTRRSIACAVLPAVAWMLAACAATPSSPDAVRFTVLTSAGCGQTHAAVKQVERVAADLGIELIVERIVVTRPDEAARLRFLGSPTLQLDGVDVDPSVRDRTDYGFA